MNFFFEISISINKITFHHMKVFYSLTVTVLVLKGVSCCKIWIPCRPSPSAGLMVVRTKRWSVLLCLLYLPCAPSDTSSSQSLSAEEQARLSCLFRCLAIKSRISLSLTAPPSLVSLVGKNPSYC